MKKQGGGAVVNISSGVGVGALPGMAPYVCTKHANVLLTKYFAAEHGKENIRFNVICPGNTWTDNWDDEMAQIHKDQHREIEEILDTVKKAAYLNKIGSPDEVGQAAAFLASPAASFILSLIHISLGGARFYWENYFGFVEFQPDPNGEVNRLVFHYSYFGGDEIGAARVLDVYQRQL